MALRNENQQDEEDSEFEEANAVLEADYEIGHFIRERLIPRAVLYFTGELIDDEEDDEDDYEDEDGDYGESDDDEDDPDFDAKKAAKQQPECKQQ